MMEYSGYIARTMPRRLQHDMSANTPPRNMGITGLDYIRTAVDILSNAIKDYSTLSGVL